MRLSAILLFFSCSIYSGSKLYSRDRSKNNALKFTTKTRQTQQRNFLVQFAYPDSIKIALSCIF